MEDDFDMGDGYSTEDDCDDQWDSDEENKQQTISDVTDDNDVFCPKGSLSRPFSTKTSGDIEFERKHEMSLSRESVMGAINRYCCKESCITQISPNNQYGDVSQSFQLVTACRSVLLGLSRSQRQDKLREIMGTFNKYGGDRLRNTQYTLSALNFCNGSKYVVCATAFEACYELTSYQRKVLLNDIKSGVNNTERMVGHWSKVHDEILKNIKSSFKSFDLEEASKDITINMSTASTAKTHKVSSCRYFFIVFVCV